MKLLNFTEFVNEGTGILNTGTHGIGNVGTSDNITTFTPSLRTKRKIKGSKANVMAQADMQPPIIDPMAYVNTLLQ